MSEKQLRKLKFCGLNKTCFCYCFWKWAHLIRRGKATHIVKSQEIGLFFILFYMVTVLVGGKAKERKKTKKKKKLKKGEKSQRRTRERSQVGTEYEKKRINSLTCRSFPVRSNLPDNLNSQIRNPAI